MHTEAAQWTITGVSNRLGPLTRQALVEAGIDEARLSGIENGTYEWTIGRAPTYGISADEETAARIAEEAAKRKDFAITIIRSEAAQRAQRPYDMSRRGRLVYEAAIPNAIGQRIARIKRYEEALATRGETQSVLFTKGTPEDWASVAVAPTWDALAFEFRRAAEALANASTDEAPVPMLPLLTLCRHHLELALKSTIMDGDRLEGNPPNLPITHRLVPLWQRALPLMRAAWKKGWDDGDARSAEEVIAEFDVVDADSMAMRYPVNKTNSAFARPAQLLNFSVTAFMAAFSLAGDFLASAGLWIDVGLRLKREGIGKE